MRRLLSYAIARSVRLKRRCARPSSSCAGCFRRSESVMTLCEQCRDLVWDYLYGLLEADQTQSFRAHLAGCGPCQATLATAEAEHTRIARAARLDVSVPRFVPPAS